MIYKDSITEINLKMPSHSSINLVNSNNLSNYQLIAFWHMNDWGEYGRRYEMCLKEIAKRRLFKRVVLVTPPLHYSVEKSVAIKLISKLYRLLIPFEVKHLDYNILHMQPVYGFIRPRWVRNYSCALFLLYLKGVILFHRTVFLAYPFHEMIGRIIKWRSVKRVITDIVDDYTEADFVDYPKERRERILRQYMELVEKSNVVLTTSSDLANKFHEYKDKIIYLPNGVDSSFITHDDVSSRREQSHAKKPVAGYVGFIDYRIDFKLLERLLGHYPYLDVVFYGPVFVKYQNNISHLQNNYDNFKYLGVIAYQGVKDAIAAFDIGIIPHKRHEFVASMSPLKAYQFLGQGKPVVIMDNAIDNGFAEYIYASRDDDEFIANIDKAVTETDVKPKQRRIDYALQNTWEQRVNILLHELDKRI